MVSLRPGATLIYERANGMIYAREFGSAEKKVVGYDVSGSPAQRNFSEWNNILQAAEANPALQDALDRVKIVYNLGRANE